MNNNGQVVDTNPFMTSEELREIADLEEYLTDKLGFVDVAVEVIDSSGKTLGHLRQRTSEGVGYVFYPKGAS